MVRLESRTVSVEDVMPYIDERILNSVPLQETRDGRLGVVLPEKGRGRYSLLNALKRAKFFGSATPASSLEERRRWNVNHRAGPLRR